MSDISTDLALEFRKAIAPTVKTSIHPKKNRANPAPIIRKIVLFERSFGSIIPSFPIVDQNITILIVRQRGRMGKLASTQSLKLIELAKPFFMTTYWDYVTICYGI